MFLLLKTLRPDQQNEPFGTRDLNLTRIPRKILDTIFNTTGKNPQKESRCTFFSYINEKTICQALCHSEKQNKNCKITMQPILGCGEAGVYHTF